MGKQLFFQKQKSFWTHFNMIQSEYIDVLKPHKISACKPSYCDGDGAGQLELVKEDDLNNIINGEFLMILPISPQHIVR